jgi:hypothetical protein
MYKLLLCLGSGVIAVSSFNSMSLSVRAAAWQQPHLLPTHKTSFVIAKADQGALVKQNKELLITNRALARKIATKLGITSTGDIPTSGTPLEQNQVLMLQNQETFKAIAVKVEATVPELTAPTGADVAEKNHNILLQNRTIVVGILKKLGIEVTAPPALTGTFVEKNNTLLIGNGKALAKIAAKLGLK